MRRITVGRIAMPKLRWLLLVMPLLMAQDYGSGVAQVGGVWGSPPAAAGGATDFTEDANCVGAWFIDSTDPDDIVDDCGGDDSLGAGESIGTPAVSVTTPGTTPAGYRSIETDATGDYYARANDAAFDADPFTACAWGMVGNGQGGDDIFRSSNDGAGPGWGINQAHGAGIWGNVHSSGTSGATTINNDTWFHACMSYNDTASGPGVENTIYVYHDGEEDCSGACTVADGKNTASGDGLSWLAQSDGGNSCSSGDVTCLLHESVYFDRQLTKYEICEICRFGVRGDVTDRDALCGSCDYTP